EAVGGARGAVDRICEVGHGHGPMRFKGAEHRVGARDDLEAAHRDPFCMRRCSHKMRLSSRVLASPEAGRPPLKHGSQILMNGFCKARICGSVVLCRHGRLPLDEEDKVHEATVPHPTKESSCPSS